MLEGRPHKRAVKGGGVTSQDEAEFLQFIPVLFNKLHAAKVLKSYWSAVFGVMHSSPTDLYLQRLNECLSSRLKQPCNPDTKGRRKSSLAWPTLESLLSLFYFTQI